MPSAAAPDSQALFKRLYANGDGVLSQEEFSSPPGKPMQQAELRRIGQGAAPALPAGKDGTVFLLPADTDGSAAALQREVSHQSFSAVAAPSMADRRIAEPSRRANAATGV